MARPPLAVRRRGQPRRLRAGRPRQRRRGRRRALLDEHLARGARSAAEPLRARRPVRLRDRRLRREPGLLRTRLLRHRPALRPVRRRPLLLAGLAGRPAHLEPGAARRRDPGLLLGAARRLGRVRGLQRRLQAHLRPRHQPRDPGIRRGLDRDRDPARADAAGAADQGAGRVDRHPVRPRRRPGGGRDHCGADRARAARPAAGPPPRHLGRGAVPDATPSSATATAPGSSTTDPEVFGNATAYGRALFTSQHLVEADARGVEKMRGREVLLDAGTRRAGRGVAPVPRRHGSPTCCTAC